MSINSILTHHASECMLSIYLIVNILMCKERLMATDRLVEDLLALWRLLRASTHPVRRAEITPEQYWLLRLLHRKGPMSISELAEVLGVTGSSITTACKRLEKAGLVKRERQGDGCDERVVLVVLTP